jgi:hypothetical protein
VRTPMRRRALLWCWRLKPSSSASPSTPRHTPRRSVRSPARR